jgi:hypothetical protein
MDRLMKIGQVLDSCLTTEKLGQVYPFQQLTREKHAQDPQILERHRKAQIDFLHLVGSLVEKEIKAALQGEELVYVCRRVDQFLIARGFSITASF